MKLLVGATIAAIAVVAAVTVASGYDAAGQSSGPMAWKSEPVRIKAPVTLPHDRTVLGTIENTSLKLLVVRAKQVRVLDTEGEQITFATVRFAGAPGHSVFDESRRKGAPLPDYEQVRIGRVLALEGGKTRPLVISWRETNGRTAEYLDYGEGRLALPTTETP